MMVKSVIDIRNDLIAAYEKEITAQSATLIRGGCKDIEEYRKATGRILGLSDAIEKTKDYFRRMTDDDDE